MDADVSGRLSAPAALARRSQAQVSAIKDLDQLAIT